jgi:ribonuclease Z
MKLTFLGTSSGAPSRSRNVSSMALQLPQQATLWLFDCGEATQHQILRSPLRLSQLERIFFTHLHGDHLFGLPGLLASRSMQNGGTTPVTLYGPAGLEEYIRVSLEVSQSHLGYPIHVETVRPGLVYEDEHFQVICAPMRHRIEAYGYAALEKAQPGQFDVERARTLGIPPGPLYGRLKNGETVALPDGRRIDGSDLVGPPRPGRKLAHCGDTIYTPAAVELARDADVLIHEATYLHAEAAQAQRGMHSTAVMAAQVAQRAAVKLLILTHFSARYEAGSQLGELLAEARAIFPNTVLAHDFYSYEIPRREPQESSSRS